MERHALLSDLRRPWPRRYWADLLGSASLGWAGFAVAVAARPWTVMHLAALVVASLALYRAVMFLHEITHHDPAVLPGFAAAWNLIVGIPLLLPSLVYEGVHLDHHRLSLYGSTRDPEYAPLAFGSRWRIALFFLAATLLPVALVLRFTVLSLASLAHPGARRWVRARASALSINPRYVRRVSVWPRVWVRQELAVSLVLITVVVLGAGGWLSWAVVAHWFVVATAIAGANAVRTLAAHRYANRIDPADMSAQLSDSCNLAAQSVVGAVAAELIAPVGLRYHALHHWVASLPYHNLREAHRRLIATLPAESTYRQVDTMSLPRNLWRLWRSARSGP